MGTPFGRFRWKRLPFGVAPAQEVFQQRLDEILMDLQGIKVIVDDIVVYGEGTTTEEATESHDKRLYALLQRAQEHGPKFNPKKFKHPLPAVPFVGHEMTEKGLKVDSSKVRAVVSMATPHNVAAVRRLMEMANYVSRFLPGLSDVMEPLRRLTRNYVEWWWGPEHDEAVETVKKALTSAPVLSYFNPKKATIIQADASQVALGPPCSRTDDQWHTPAEPQPGWNSSMHRSRKSCWPPCLDWKVRPVRLRSSRGGTN